MGLLASALVACALPATAAAHGPVAPVASSYLAKVLGAPPGFDAKVVDGDQRMWLRTPSGETVVILDYRGAPYLRFTAHGVEVNQNSAMFYLNQTPIALPPPPGITATTAPSWHRVAGGQSYEWHDGRLHALAAVALSPGASFVGRWTIPVRVDGRLGSISGALWHAEDPSLVWFWAIAVILACVLAAWRVRRPRLDMLMARLLAVAALVALVLGALGRQLHGRPTVSVFQVLELTAILAFAGWALWRVLSRRAGYFSYFLIGAAAVWEGGVMIGTLLNGFVLIAEPTFLARVVTVACLGCGAGLLLFVFRLSDLSEPAPESDEPAEPVAGERGGVTESVA